MSIFRDQFVVPNIDINTASCSIVTLENYFALAVQFAPRFATHRPFPHLRTNSRQRLSEPTSENGMAGSGRGMKRVGRRAETRDARGAGRAIEHAVSKLLTVRQNSSGKVQHRRIRTIRQRARIFALGVRTPSPTSRTPGVLLLFVTSYGTVIRSVDEAGGREPRAGSGEGKPVTRGRVYSFRVACSR